MPSHCPMVNSVYSTDLFPELSTLHSTEPESSSELQHAVNFCNSPVTLGPKVTIDQVFRQHVFQRSAESQLPQHNMDGQVAQTINC